MIRIDHIIGAFDINAAYLNKFAMKRKDIVQRPPIFKPYFNKINLV